MGKIENEKAAGGVETNTAAFEAKHEHYAMLMKTFSWQFCCCAMHEAIPCT